MTKIVFTSHGYKLAGNLFMATKPSKLAFLFIQGWLGHQNLEAAQALADLGFSSLTYDMRGHGESAGNIAEFSRADFIEDAALAYDFLIQQVGQEVEIGVVGSSFGGYTAAVLSGKRPIKCLSLRVPASYPDEGFDKPQVSQAETQDLDDWRKIPLDYAHNHAFKALNDFDGNVQIIEAEHDELVPHQAVANYVNAVVDKSKLEHVVLRDAPHRLVNDKLRAEYIKLLTEWAGKQ